MEYLSLDAKPQEALVLWDSRNMGILYLVYEDIYEIYELMKSSLLFVQTLCESHL